VPGLFENAMCHVLGLPTFYRFTQPNKTNDTQVDTELLWSELVQATSRQFIMTA
jgi:hypothetical protein